MVTIRLKYVTEDVDRHGNVRLYFRRPGQSKIRLRGIPGSDEFMRAYKRALAGELAPGDGRLRPTPPPVRGSLRALCEAYFRSAEFGQLDSRTQRIRRNTLEKLCREFGDKPFARLEARHVRALRDAKADKPEAANTIVKSLRAVFAYAVKTEAVTANPALAVELLKTGSQGFHSWSIDEIRQFEERHPVGTKARLALALLLYTGQRRSDIVAFGRQHVRDGWLTFTQTKNRNRKPITLSIPVIPALQAVIDAMPAEHLTFLVTEFGKPFTANGFGNRFRKWCDEAGLPHCSAHGLRKATAARLAELGASEQEIMAVTGHRTSKEVSRYTRAANQKVLAESAMTKLAGSIPGTELSHVKPSSVPSGTNAVRNSLKRKEQKR